MAPVLAALRRRLPEARHTLVHTGQHRDHAMSQVLFDELGLPEPDHLLAADGARRGQRTAAVISRLARLLAWHRPHLVVVSGDVDSTLATAVAAGHAGIPLAHVEAGLRSFDRSMPEELNRVIADRVAERHFVHCADAVENLRREGITGESVRFVGNTMIDTLVATEDRFRALDMAGRLGVSPGGFVLVPLPRPALVEGPLLGEAMAQLARLARHVQVVFPVHPRTRKRLAGLR